MIDDTTPRTSTAARPRRRFMPHGRVAIVLLRLALTLLDRGRHFDAAADVIGALDKLGWMPPSLSEAEANAWLDKHNQGS